MGALEFRERVPLARHVGSLLRKLRVESGVKYGRA